MSNSGPISAGSPPKPPVQQVRCFKCAALIDASYEFCPQCGQRQRKGDAWYYNPVPILLLALFVIGPFALPLVWKSRKMTGTVKAVLAAVILAYTALCAYYFYQVAGFYVRELRTLDQIMREIR